MATKSKYANDFNIGENIALCKWCDYKYPLPKQFSTASLRHHIKLHHPERFTLLVKSEKEAEKAKTTASQNLLKQQNSLKRLMCESSAAEQEKSGPPNKRPMMKKGDQPTIFQSLRINKSFNILNHQFNYIVQWEEEGDKTKLITKRIAQMICVDLQPYSMVEKPGFKKLMEEVAPRYKLKYARINFIRLHFLLIRGRKFFSNIAIPNTFEEMHKKVMDEIGRASYISITTDAWDDLTHKHSLLAVTGIIPSIQYY